MEPCGWCVWAGIEVSHWVKEYSQSERKTDYKALVTKAQHFGWPGNIFFCPSCDSVNPAGTTKCLICRVWFLYDSPDFGAL
eukprot:380254-Lingulodinium_polyedra.AAC.1